MLYLINVDAL